MSTKLSFPIRKRAAEPGSGPLPKRSQKQRAPFFLDAAAQRREELESSPATVIASSPGTLVERLQNATDFERVVREFVNLCLIAAMSQHKLRMSLLRLCLHFILPNIYTAAIVCVCRIWPTATLRTRARWRRSGAPTTRRGWRTRCESGCSSLSARCTASMTRLAAQSLGGTSGTARSSCGAASCRSSGAVFSIPQQEPFVMTMAAAAGRVTGRGKNEWLNSFFLVWWARGRVLHKADAVTVLLVRGAAEPNNLVDCDDAASGARNADAIHTRYKRRDAPRVIS